MSMGPLIKKILEKNELLFQLQEEETSEKFFDGVKFEQLSRIKLLITQKKSALLLSSTRIVPLTHKENHSSQDRIFVSVANWNLDDKYRFGPSSACYWSNVQKREPIQGWRNPRIRKYDYSERKSVGFMRVWKNPNLSLKA